MKMAMGVIGIIWAASAVHIISSLANSVTTINTVVQALSNL